MRRAQRSIFDGCEDWPACRCADALNDRSATSLHAALARLNGDPEAPTRSEIDAVGTMARSVLLCVAHNSPDVKARREATIELFKSVYKQWRSS